MLDIHEVKKLLGDEQMSDEEAETYCDACFELAEIIVSHRKWKREKRTEV